MYGLVVRLFVVELLYLTHGLNGAQSYNVDLNRILNYLQKQYKHHNDDNDRGNSEVMFQEALGSKINTGPKSTHYISQYVHDNRKNSMAPESGEVPELDIKDLKDFLSQKTQDRVYIHNPKSESTDKYKNNNLQHYSKVYLVLNPSAKITIADAKRIGQIVSSLISSNGNIETKQKPEAQARRYKGFVIMDDFFARRRNRDSKEKYSKDSIERDYKPKRIRSEYGVGGGRTAIPYIRHRGDIYEKD